MISKKMMGAGLAAGLGALYMGTRDRKNDSNVIEMSDKTFNELKAMRDEKGQVDVGRYLQSKAFNEWLYSDFNPQVDDRIVAQIYRSIVNSYKDKDKGHEVATRFVNVVATNKPNYVFPTRREGNM